MSVSPTPPLVSVVMPTYNRSTWLRRAVASVLAQTFTDFELIVVDDCSTDDTEETVGGFQDERIRYVRLSINTGGCAIPRNIGFELARGKYLASLDDDYLWDKDKLQRQVDFLDAHPDHVLVGTNAIALDEAANEVGRITWPEEDAEIRSDMLSSGRLVQGSVLFRNAAVAASGGYAWCQDRVYCEDYERWLKLGTVGKMANLPEHLVSFITLAGVSSGHRLGWCLVNIRMARRYRRYYPNHSQAMALRYLSLVNVSVHVASDATPFKQVKLLLKQRWPAGWRLIAGAHGAALGTLSKCVMPLSGPATRKDGASASAHDQAEPADHDSARPGGKAGRRG